MTRKKIIAVLITICLIVIGSMPFTVTAATAPKLSATSKSLFVGDSYTLKVTGSNIKSKSFSSSNKNVATVTSKGVVKAVKKGSATITATVKYKSGSKTVTKKLNCKITVKAFVTPTASPTSKTIYVGDTFTMSKSGSNITSVTYTTSNKAVATVTSNGVVKGVKTGTATITATIKYNQNGSVKTKKVTCKVTVKAFVTPTASPTSKTIYVGDTFTMSKSGSNITSVTYTTSNKAVATVTSNGVVKGVKTGTATITATIKYNQNGSVKTKKVTCKVTVKAFVTPTASPTSKTIYVGNTFTMSKSGSNITSVTYTTSNKAVATVTTNGVVKGVKTGTATITATIKYNQNGSVKTKKVTCKVTVKAKPTTTTTTTTQPTTKPTTQPVTDKDGYNNQILKP